MSRDPHPDYEVVIGLEVHVHLRTESKLFSPAPVRYGEEPNHSVHPICLALPGVLPVLNARAVELGIRAALATHCVVPERSIFARKNYFYPALPKGYQISHVDLNRAGVPLLEIVSEPDLRSPAEAGAYLRTLRSILRYIDISDADMEKGHLRCDVNVSLRPKGARELGTRTELKNLNSFRFVEEALGAEIERQAGILDEGGCVEQATLAYDPNTRRTRVLRVKENADDYSYFPDPDLVPLQIGSEQIERVRAGLPELAEQKRERFELDYGLSAYDAGLLTQSRALADFFEDAVAGYGQAKPVANWMLRDLLRALGEQEREIDEAAITPEALASLIRLVDEGRTSPQSARGLVAELVEQGGDPEALVRERGLAAVSDAYVLEAVVDEVLAASSKDVERYRAGEKKVVNFLMGQVMKRTQGKANPGSVREILLRKLED